MSPIYCEEDMQESPNPKHISLIFLHLRMKRYAYIWDEHEHTNGVPEEEEREACLNIRNPAI